MKYRNYPSNKSIIINGIKSVKDNYNPRQLIENDPWNKENDTSYTIDKGELIDLCLRYKDNPSDIHNYNDILYVTLHELSHIFTDEYGHHDEFWDNFKFILTEATDYGIYQPHDYSQDNIDYCGLKISYSPLFE